MKSLKEIVMWRKELREEIPASLQMAIALQASIDTLTWVIDRKETP